ncbi:MAG: hypothetical protein R2873_02940 [Caldilineaceae bacterium]
MQTSLSALDASLTALDEQVSSQGVAMAELEVTRRNFGHLTAALSQALSEMNAMQAEEAEAAAPMEAVAVAEAPAAEEAPVAEAAAEEAPAAEAMAMPMVVSEAALAANSVAAYLFVDNNADGMLNDDEEALVGATFPR